MEENLQKGLVERYPIIFQDVGGNPRQTAMSWGILVDDGWFLIIEDACNKITKLTKNTGIDVVASQVKEKFGGLRFYYHTIENTPQQKAFIKFTIKFRSFMYKHKWGKLYNKVSNFRRKFYKTIYEKIDDVITEVEMKSYTTCERCGNPGKRYGNGWIKTLCDGCINKEN